MGAATSEVDYTPAMPRRDDHEVHTGHVVTLEEKKLDKYIHPVGLLWTNDGFVAEFSTFTTHNKHKGRTSMTSAGFEPAMPAIEHLQTYALDPTANAIRIISSLNLRYVISYTVSSSLSSSSYPKCKFLTVSAKLCRSCCWLPSGSLFHK